MPHVNFSLLVVIQRFCSVSSSHYRKDGLFGDKICNSSWLVNQLATIDKVRTATGQMLVMSSLKTYHDIFFGCCGIINTLTNDITV